MRAEVGQQGGAVHVCFEVVMEAPGSRIQTVGVAGGDERMLLRLKIAPGTVLEPVDLHARQIDLEDVDPLNAPEVSRLLTMRPPVPLESSSAREAGEPATVHPV